MTNIKKILIANRGEIALRVIRTAREMGIATVAVYSEADLNGLHVKYADEAVCIGAPAASESYLNQDKIIQAAKDTGADAIHPGYGFLSENSSFARLAAENGLIFIGPSPESIELMGDKLMAKEAVRGYDIPQIPGGEKSVEDPEVALDLAEKIGYPVLIKASAGGGGKGMRVVDKPENLKEQMERAVSEAASSFGDKRVFIEKYITSPRHIEIQVMGDEHGNVVYLFERECSIQRRHQKVIEEAPSSILTPEKRKEMGECAIMVAKACNYVGAGTVEFILDENMDFYFLEMNTRLQVEHPVTEMITGKDLVRAQIEVASGEKLKWTQDDLEIRGHSIEVRVYAEDPENNFLPDIGTLQTYRRPQGPGVRVDDGFEEGMKIPIYYDPMIAKLVTYAENRQAAIDRMIRAIDEYIITGVKTTMTFCRFVMEHEAFTTGNFDTNFVRDLYTPSMLHEKEYLSEEEIAAIAALLAYQNQSPKVEMNSNNHSTRSWKRRLKDY